MRTIWCWWCLFWIHSKCSKCTLGKSQIEWRWFFENKCNTARTIGEKSVSSNANTTNEVSSPVCFGISTNVHNIAVCTVIINIVARSHYKIQSNRIESADMPAMLGICNMVFWSHSTRRRLIQCGISCIQFFSIEKRSKGIGKRGS